MAGFATPATSVVLGRPSKEAKPCSTTRCAGSAPACSRTEGPRHRHTGPMAPLCPSHLHSDLPGYPGGSDVIGNQVRNQFQLDLFGEVLLLLANAASRDRLNSDGWDAAELAIRAIARAIRGEGTRNLGDRARSLEHSRLICVAGLRAIAETLHPLRVTSRRPCPWPTTYSAWPIARPSTIQAVGSASPTDARVDASLLLAEIRGAVGPEDPRYVATRHAVIDDLCEDDYIYRYAEPGEPLGHERGRLSDL